MVWTGLLSGQKIDLRAIPSEDRQAMHADKVRLTCPACLGRLDLWQPEKDLYGPYAKFFHDRKGPLILVRHGPNYAAACVLAGGNDESPEHAALKHHLAAAAAAAGWDAELEVYREIDGHKCRADVVATKDGRSRVLEAQFASIRVPDIEARHQLYQRAFGTTTWSHTGRPQWRTKIPAVQVDGDDLTVVIGGVYADQGGHEVAPPMPLSEVVPRRLEGKLRWIPWGDDGFFIDVETAHPSAEGRRKPKRRIKGERRYTGEHVSEECDREPKHVEREPTSPAQMGPLAVEVLTAWTAWENWPGAAPQANQMEDACAKAASELGVTTTELRDRLMAARRSGLSHVEAVMKVVG